MNKCKTAIAVVCAGLAWCSVASAGVTTTGSVYDNPTIYPTEIRVAYGADGSLAIDDDSDLARDISTSDTGAAIPARRQSPDRARPSMLTKTTTPNYTSAGPGTEY